MARRRKPGLTPEDHEIWRKVAASVTPLSGSAAGAAAQTGLLASTAAPLSDPPQPADGAEMSRPLAPGSEPPALVLPNRFRIGMAARPAPPRHDVLPPLPERLAAAAPKVDGGIQAKLRRGKLRPEARIDLHGMTLSEAHPALTGFLLDAQARGRRLVLVITGKGKDRDGDRLGPAPRGILRHQVPHWVQIGILAAVVLQITPAHIRHGGEGAYYVYLKRRR